MSYFHDGGDRDDQWSPTVDLILDEVDFYDGGGCWFGMGTASVALECHADGWHVGAVDVLGQKGQGSRKVRLPAVSMLLGDKTLAELARQHATYFDAVYDEHWAERPGRRVPA